MKDFPKTFGAYALCALIAAAVSVTVPAVAGTITGYVYNPLHSNLNEWPQSEMAISVDKIGNFAASGYGIGRTWAAEPVGWFTIDNLAVGNYSMMYHEKDLWARYLLFDQVIPSTSPWKLTVDRRIKYQDMVTAIGGGPNAVNWCQSFRATGPWVTMVALHQTTEFGPNTEISILDGDSPTGAQIGPSRTIPTVVVNPTAAYWSAGEVPTIPGRLYTVRFRVPTGQPNNIPFRPFGRIQGGNAYPDGRTWADGAPMSGPIKMTVCNDDDGIYTVVNTKKTNSSGLPLAYSSVTTLGQTFTAKGSSLLCVSLLVGNTGGTRLRCTIHDGPGLNGQGGTQIGPGKYIAPIDWDARSAAVWKPGEVPLTDGQSYYVKIWKDGGGAFTVYYVPYDEYPGGMLYLDGNAQASADLSTTIACEAYTGSLAVPSISISNISVTRGTNTATITWTTDVATTTNYVDYSKSDTPYTDQASDPAGGTSHSVTLNGLTPNMIYHYRVVSKESGYRDSYSRDFVFVTDPASPNMLQNPGFEDGATSWTGYAIYGGNMAVRSGYPWTPSGNPSYFGCQAHGGSNFYGGAVNGSGALRGGVYQVVPVTPGRQLRLRAWLWTWQSDNIGGMEGYTVRGRVGIDPIGMTNPNRTGIAWSPFTVAQDLFGAGTGYWTEVHTQAAAAADHVTVFLEGGCDNAIAWIVFGLDDAVMTEVLPTQVSRISDIRSLPDGTFVQLPEKPVTAAKSEVGANYLEEADRSCALRVESFFDFTTYYKVSVAGTKGTKPTGEVYLYDASVLSGSAADEPGSLTVVAKNVKAGGVGLGNVAMLMQVTGKISIGEGNIYYIQDGSLPDLGLRIDTSSLTILPTEDEYYAITGIVQLVGTSPENAVPVIRPRFNDDVQQVQ